MNSIYIISKDNRITIVRSKNKYSVMRHLLKDDAWPNTYWCGRMGMKKNDVNSLLIATAFGRYITQNKLCLCPELKCCQNASLDDLEKYIEMDRKDIINQLSDDDISSLFRYMFTGGIGDQYGIPGKEWNTYTVNKLDLDNIPTI